MTAVSQPDEVKPCPFCGTILRRVVSKARAFNPPRDYVEWHHDTPVVGGCFIWSIRGSLLAATGDDAVEERHFLVAWNYRAAISKAEQP